MSLEIKNLKSGETHHIPPEGALLGREGAKADIQVRDPGVSKKHARIYEKGGVWYLQDVGSSNGTFMQGKRLTGPIELAEGSVFGMSRHKFKVVRIEGLGGLDDDEPLFNDDLAPPEPDYDPPDTRQPPLPDSGSNGHSPREISGMAPGGEPAPDLPMDAMQPGPMPGSQPGTSAGGGGGDEIEAKGIGYFFVAVPKAIAYYLGAVPALAFAPPIYVKRGIENQKHAPMGRMELIAYAIPALLFSGMFGSICAGIGTLIGGGGFVFSAFIPIGATIGGLIGAIITGLIWHPVCEFLIRILKGSSDARSRTNYFLMTMTATALVAIPSGLGTLLLATGWPFVAAVGPLLTGVASLLTGYVMFKWLRYFDIIKAIPIILFVLIGLGALASVGSAISIIVNDIGSIGGGDQIEVSDDMPPPLKAAIEAYNLGVENCQGNDACLQGVEASRASFEAQLDEWKKTQEAAEDKSDETGGNDDDDGNTGGNKDDDTAGKDDDTAGKDDDTAGKDDDTAGKDEKKPTNTTKKTPPTPARRWPSVSYNDFAGRRGLVRWMEGYISADPTNLMKIEGLRERYENYHRIKHEVESKYAKQTEASPGLKEVHDKLAEAEIYQRAAKDVQEFKAIAERSAK